jgi:hypothetical protein
MCDPCEGYCGEWGCMGWNGPIIGEGLCRHGCGRKAEQCRSYKHDTAERARLKRHPDAWIPNRQPVFSPPYDR